LHLLPSPPLLPLHPGPTLFDGGREGGRGGRQATSIKGKKLQRRINKSEAFPLSPRKEKKKETTTTTTTTTNNNKKDKLKQQEEEEKEATKFSCMDIIYLLINVLIQK
jgi:hypothetical protein